MGMNRPSLYGAFGDKRDLYLATLERYVALSRADMAKALDADAPLAKGVQRVYDRALALYFADVASPLGCFLIGTAATEAARDPGVRAVLGSGLRALTQAFEARFRKARKSGELSASANPKLLSEMAAAVLFSLALRARAGDSRASAREVLAPGGEDAHDGRRPRPPAAAPASDAQRRAQRGVAERSQPDSVPLISPASFMRRFGSPSSSSQRAPSLAPFSIATVVAVPATRQRSATTLTLRMPVTGQPVRGSSTCV